VDCATWRVHLAPGDVRPVLSSGHVATQPNRGRRPANHWRADSTLGQLAGAGNRLTGVWAKVVRELAVREAVVTREQLVAELQPRGISRSTVYCKLELLERRGLLARMHLDTVHGYIVCDDGHDHHHHHQTTVRPSAANWLRIASRAPRAIASRCISRALPTATRCPSTIARAPWPAVLLG
jgi:ferric uptake regulator family protein